MLHVAVKEQREKNNPRLNPTWLWEFYSMTRQMTAFLLEK